MKKLIIVAVLIMLASCSTVKQRSVLPAEIKNQPALTSAEARIRPALSSAETTDTSALSPAGTQDQLILATLWYQKSAEMRALYYQCFRNAEMALKENLEQHRQAWSAPEPPLTESGALSRLSDGGREADCADYFPGRGLVKPAAVVLDIDETLLDNSPFQGWQVLEAKEFNDEDWFRWVELSRARPLPGAVEFTRYADSLGVEVFYVSNRTVQEMGPTIENMAGLGFVNADSTHMLLKENTSSKVERRSLIEKDYEIILLVGDNLADHSGIYEKRGPDNGFAAVEADRRLFGTKYIVLPNPMYGNWLNELLRSAQGSTEREKLLQMLEGY